MADTPSSSMEAARESVIRSPIPATAFAAFSVGTAASRRIGDVRHRRQIEFSTWNKLRGMQSIETQGAIMTNASLKDP